ncbi:MAG: hypothetical protein WD136_00010 [Cyanobium sp.]
MSPVRGIPTSRAYWELKAEQVLNRVFDPEKPIEVEVCDTSSPTPSWRSTPVGDLPAAPKPPNSSSTRGRPSQHWIDQLGRKPSLLLIGAGVTAVVVAGSALFVLGIWHQSQLAIRQERNMLLIERLRTMGPGSPANAPTESQTTETQTAAAPAGAGQGGEGELPPPPPGEPWMEDLASLPSSNAPSAAVLKVPVTNRITSPAPAASGTSNAPQLVGVVQVPGQSGSAIFQIGGSSTSAAVGESIGSSGWRLHSANGDSAVIEKGGEQRRVSISSGY